MRRRGSRGRSGGGAGAGWRVVQAAAREGWSGGAGSIIVFFDRVQYRTITHVSVFGYLSFAYGFFYFTAGLFEVQAIIKLALADEGAHFGEITGELLSRDIDQAELAHAGGVDDLAGVWARGAGNRGGVAR